MAACVDLIDLTKSPLSSTGSSTLAPGSAVLVGGLTPDLSELDPLAPADKGSFPAAAPPELPASWPSVEEALMKTGATVTQLSEGLRLPEAAFRRHAGAAVAPNRARTTLRQVLFEPEVTIPVELYDAFLAAGKMAKQRGSHQRQLRGDVKLLVAVAA
mmetsp:Transcript_78847/g.225865  ORF Transcript_78847/g.225865 Transcript_78847/m.225865 type:complete len:158 (-) Transcript_78847:196-669(-)